LYSHRAALVIPTAPLQRGFYETRRHGSAWQLLCGVDIKVVADLEYSCHLIRARGELPEMGRLSQSKSMFIV
jgi:hypothetical protein